MNATVQTPAEPTITISRKTAALALIGLSVHLNQLKGRLARMNKADFFARQLLEEGIAEFTLASTELSAKVAAGVVF